jgi:hypothetical protein
MVSLGKWSTNDGFPHRTVSLQDGKCNYNAHFREAFVMVSLHLTMQKNMTSNLTLGRRRGEKGGRGVARRGLSGNTICNIYIYMYIYYLYMYIYYLYMYIYYLYIYISFYILIIIDISHIITANNGVGGPFQPWPWQPWSFSTNLLFSMPCFSYLEDLNPGWMDTWGFPKMGYP